MTAVSYRGSLFFCYIFGYRIFIFCNICCSQ
nr:MAG TPA: hypothetical protein [Caudoviricetes sp.]